MKAAVYIRVSTEEQADNFGVDAQRRRCEAFCEMKGWEIAERYEDLGVSGATLERPGLQRLLQDSANGAWDVVVTYKVDRLSRSVRQLCSIWEDYLSPNGKGLASCEESFDTNTPTGRFFLKLLGIFAEMEREAIKERMEGGRWEAARQGNWLAPVAPFGYRRVVNDGKKALEINEPEAEVVRRIFTWCTEEGLGAPTITDRLNAVGTPTASRFRQSKQQGYGFWQVATVSRILHNSVYCGEAYLRREIGRTNKSRPQFDENGHQVWIPVPVPAIISKDLFDKAQRVRASNSRVSGGMSKVFDQYLLRNVAFCGDCGAHLSGAAAWGAKGRPIRYYRCLRRSRQRPREREHGCKFKAVPAERLEEVVWRHVREAILNPELLAEHSSLDLQDAAALQTELAQLDKNLSDLDGQRERVRWLFTRETITFPELQKDLAKLGEQRKVAEEQRARVALRLAQQEDIQARLQQVSTLLEEVRRRIDHLSPEEKRTVLRDLGLRVVVKPDRALQIEAIVPLPPGQELLYPKVSVSLHRVRPIQQFEGLSALLSFAIAVPSREMARARVAQGA
jgi:site-specific DNA recombinase